MSGCLADLLLSLLATLYAEGGQTLHVNSGLSGCMRPALDGLAPVRPSRLAGLFVGNLNSSPAFAGHPTEPATQADKRSSGGHSARGRGIQENMAPRLGRQGFVSKLCGIRP